MPTNKRSLADWLIRVATQQLTDASFSILSQLRHEFKGLAKAFQGIHAFSESFFRKTPYYRQVPLLSLAGGSVLYITLGIFTVSLAALPERMQVLLPENQNLSSPTVKPLSILLQEANVTVEVIYPQQLKVTPEGTPTLRHLPSENASLPLLVVVDRFTPFETLEALHHKAKAGQPLILLSLETDLGSKRAQLSVYQPLFKDLSLPLQLEAITDAWVTQGPALKTRVSPWAGWVDGPLGEAFVKPIPKLPEPPDFMKTAGTVSVPLSEAIAPNQPLPIPERQNKELANTASKTASTKTEVKPLDAQALAAQKEAQLKQKKAYELALATATAQRAAIEQQRSKAIALLENVLETLGQKRYQAEVAGQRSPAPLALLEIYRQQRLQELEHSRRLCLEALDISQRITDDPKQKQVAYEAFQATKQKLANVQQATTKEGVNQAFEQAKEAYYQALVALFPPQPGQGKAIWLDRGAMVAAGKPEALRKQVRLLKEAGFNLVFVEAINSGFPIYPSQVLPQQNPTFVGWDPLAVLVEEAHKQGMEAHAWVWCFAVGNTRHNPIINLPESYRGPILSTPELGAQPLVMSDGALVPRNQHEYWLSPADPTARALLLSAYRELVQRYKIDGLQLDYIRYPWQKRDQVAGFDPVTRKAFEAETGKSLSWPMDAATAKAFQDWKVTTVSRFVEQTSRELKAINPKLALSAAVFPLPRPSRLNQIQQDWETWIANGWIDILVPMAYTDSPSELRQQLYAIHLAAQKGALVYPGLGLHNLNAEGLLEHLMAVQQTGMPGHTLFAYSHLKDPWAKALAAGPQNAEKNSPHVDLYQHAAQPLPHTNPSPLIQASLSRWDGWIQTESQRQSRLPDHLKARLDTSHTVNSELLLKDLRQFQQRLDFAKVSSEKQTKALWPYEDTLALQEWQQLKNGLQQWVRASLQYHPYLATYFTGDLNRLDLLVRYYLRQNNLLTIELAESSPASATSTLGTVKSVSHSPLLPAAAEGATASVNTLPAQKPEADSLPLPQEEANTAIGQDTVKPPSAENTVSVQPEANQKATRKRYQLRPDRQGKLKTKSPTEQNPLPTGSLEAKKGLSPLKPSQNAAAQEQAALKTPIKRESEPAYALSNGVATPPSEAVLPLLPAASGNATTLAPADVEKSGLSPLKSR